MKWRLAIIALAATLALSVPPNAAAGRTLIVGEGGYATIQAAVDDAEPGDVVLIMPGVYQESVLVETSDITIRGWSRESVVLDGGGFLDEGIHVLADGVSVESLTVQNYDANGVAFTDVTGWRMFDLHAKNNRVYGLYAIHATRGELSHSFAEGHGDGGLYIGKVADCDCDVHHNVAWNNAIGYSGTANGHVRIWANEFYDNRAGIFMSVLPGDFALGEDGTLYGFQTRTRIYDNHIHDNNNKDAPLAGFTETITPPWGIGIALGGGWFNEVYGNRVEDNALWGIGVHWLVTPPRGNFVHGNDISGSRFGIWWDEWGEDHCFRDNAISNVRTVSDPDPLPTCPGLAGDLPCPGETEDWLACRASDARPPSVYKDVWLAWRTFTHAEPDEDPLPIG